MATGSCAQWNNYLATGVKVPPGGQVPLRQELNNLSPEAKELYLEGLRRFQAVESTDPLSYFQIAGIHGLPYNRWPDKNWNGDIKGKTLTDGDNFGGFCTHSSILFLTWHRPYLALFESALYVHVNDAAKEIIKKLKGDDPKKQDYMTAAENFRIPYWDWARSDTQIVPQIALEPGNPLFAFKFPDGTTPDITWKGKDGPYPTTVRYPDPQPPDSEGHIDTILDKMKGFKADPSMHDFKKPTGLPFFPSTLPAEFNLTERTAYILLRYRTYAAVSKNSLRVDKDHSAVVDAANWGGLEDIHNAIHNLTGGSGNLDAPRNYQYGGHMSSIAVSAFDPIFWLHHANIDRLFAIWQTLHENESDPNAFVVNRKAGMGTFTTPRNGEESVDTPLYPFRPDKNTWFTSDMCKLTESFGYAYPETRGFSHPLSEGDKEKVRAKIEDLYHPTFKYIMDSKALIKTAGDDILPRVKILQEIEVKRQPATAAQMEEVVAEMPSGESLHKEFSGPSKRFLHMLAPDNKYLEWLVNIKAEKHALSGAYAVHVFMGEPAEPNVALWPVSPSHVGTFAPLGQPTTTGCGKCQDDQRDKMQVTSQIPLTLALVERYLAGIIDNLDEESVEPYLIKNLHWRVAKLDGTIVEDRSEITNLTVFVISNQVTLPADVSQRPYYAPDVKIYPNITTNKNGHGRGNGTGLTADDVPLKLFT